MCKKLLCLFLAMLMLLASVPAFAEDDLIIDDEFEEIDDFEDEQEGEDLPVDIGSLTEYDYEHITVGNPTPLNGQFFTAMWGNSTSDIDVRKLVSAYSMISWDTSISQFRFDHSVVSGAVVLGEQDGARTYYISLYSDLFYSDGTPITAWDYAFSVLLTGSPLIAELGGVPERYDFLEGFEDYAAGKTPYISGLRVLNDYQLMFRFRADAFPYFYELSRFDITRENGVFIVSGPAVTHLVDSVNFEDEESLNWFHRTLRRTGVIDALKEAGAREGSTVQIADMEFDFIE